MLIERVVLIGERRIIVVSGRARKIDNEIDAHSFGRADAVAGRYAGAGRVRVHLAAVDAARPRGDEDVGAVVVARLGKADPRGVAADKVLAAYVDIDRPGRTASVAPHYRTFIGMAPRLQ